MEQSMFCSSECSELFEIMNRRWSSSLSVSLGGNEKEPLFFGDIFLAIVTPDSSSCGDFDKLKNATNLLSWVTLTLSLFGSSFFEQKTGGKVPSTLLPSRIQLYQAFTKWREIWYQGLKNLRRQGWLCNAIFLPNAGVLIRVNSPFWKKLPNKQTFCTYCSKH